MITQEWHGVVFSRKNQKLLNVSKYSINGWKWNWFEIKTLRSDNGGELTSNEFWDYCEEHGIKRKFLAAQTPQQNGVVEWKNRTT